MHIHTVILANVPRISPKNADSARRFARLVDMFYDVWLKWVVSAQACPDELFTEGVHSAGFARTASRLTEMQSSDYLQLERRRSDG